MGMNATLLAALAFLGAAIPVTITLLTIGAPFLRTWLQNHVRQQELQRLHNSLRGAAAVVSMVAKETKGFTLDDGIAQILVLSANEVGRAYVEKYGKEAVAYALALHADDRRKDIHLGDSNRATLPFEIAKDAVTIAKGRVPDIHIVR